MALGHWLKDYIGPHSGGSGGGGTEPLIVTANYDESTDEAALDHTWQEIYNAFVGGRNVLLVMADHPIRVLLVTDVDEQSVSPEETNFRVKFGETSYYVATSADGYPVNVGAR